MCRFSTRILILLFLLFLLVVYVIFFIEFTRPLKREFSLPLAVVKVVQRRGVYELEVGRPYVVKVGYEVCPLFWGRYFNVTRSGNVAVVFLVRGPVTVDIFVNGTTQIVVPTRIERSRVFILRDLGCGTLIEPRVWSGLENVVAIVVCYYEDLDLLRLRGVPEITIALWNWGDLILLLFLIAVGIIVVILLVKGKEVAPLLLIAYLSRFLVLLPALFVRAVNLSAGSVTELFVRYDAGHYILLSRTGYTFTCSWAFYPLYPALLHFFTKCMVEVYDVSTIACVGIVLSTSMFFTSLIVFYYLTKMLLKSREVAFYSCSLLSLFPGSLFLSGIYPHSLHLFLSLLSFYLFEIRNLLLASLTAFLTSLTVPYGFLVCLVPLARFLVERRIRYLLYVYLCILGLGVFLLMSSCITGTVLTPLVVECTWPKVTIFDLGKISLPYYHVVFALYNLSFLMLGTALTLLGVLLFISSPYGTVTAYFIYCFVLALVFMQADACSLMRLSTAVFAMYWVLAYFCTRYRILRYVLFTIFSSLLTYSTTHFVGGYPGIM